MRWTKGVLGVAALALALLLVYLLTAGWLELAIVAFVALIAFTFGRLSARLPGISFRKNPDSVVANENEQDDSFAAHPSRSGEEVDVEKLLSEETTELGFEEIDADELAARIQREVEQRQRSYDPSADLAARREKLARRQP